jgi:hypothetical protein
MNYVALAANRPSFSWRKVRQPARFTHQLPIRLINIHDSTNSSHDGVWRLAPTVAEDLTEATGTQEPSATGSQAGTRQPWPSVAGDTVEPFPAHVSDRSDS